MYSARNIQKRSRTCRFSGAGLDIFREELRAYPIRSVPDFRLARCWWLWEGGSGVRGGREKVRGMSATHWAGRVDGGRPRGQEKERDTGHRRWGGHGSEATEEWRGEGRVLTWRTVMSFVTRGWTRRKKSKWWKGNDWLWTPCTVSVQAAQASKRELDVQTQVCSGLRSDYSSRSGGSLANRCYPQTGRGREMGRAIIREG